MPSAAIPSAAWRAAATRGFVAIVQLPDDRADIEGADVRVQARWERRSIRSRAWAALATSASTSLAGSAAIVKTQRLCWAS